MPLVSFFFLSLLALGRIFSSHALAEGNNAILNPSFEVDANFDNNPDFWIKDKWGSNNASFTYPVAGVNGQKAAQVKITSYRSGDAKWQFQDVPVNPGEEYVFQDSYTSTARTYIIAQYRKSNGQLVYVQLQALPRSSTWQTTTVNFTPPAGTVSMTMLHVLSTKGTLVVDNYSLSSVSEPEPSPTPFPSPSPTPSPSVEPTPEPSPSPSLEPTPSPSVEPSPSPSADTFDEGFVSLTFDDGGCPTMKKLCPFSTMLELKEPFTS